MCSHQKENTCILLCYFLWRLQKERACGRGGVSPICTMVGKPLWDGASSSSGFCRCFCASCTSTVPRYSPTLFCIHLCLLDPRSDSDFNSSISQLFLSTPSRWCHHVAHLFEQFLIGGFLCLLQGRHMSYDPPEFLPSPSVKIFSPRSWILPQKAFIPLNFPYFPHAI